MRKWWILKGILFMLAGIALFTLVVFFLWNSLVPALFGGPQITFLQAAGILILSKVLFGWGWGGRHRWGHRWGYRGRQFKAKWEAMTPEEREKFREQMAHRCGRGKWQMHEEEKPSGKAQATS